MKRELDVRGMIGPLGAFEIQRSILYKALTAQCGDIEIWRADNHRQDSWWYYWLVSQTGGAVQQQALVRYSYDTDQLQERIEGPFGRELWADVSFDKPSERDGGASRGGA